MSSRLVGRVKWFCPKNGFGVITPRNENRDVFVHYTALRADKYLVQGESVDFRVTQPTDERHDRIAFDCEQHKNTKN